MDDFPEKKAPKRLQSAQIKAALGDGERGRNVERSSWRKSPQRRHASGWKSAFVGTNDDKMLHCSVEDVLAAFETRTFLFPVATVITELAIVFTLKGCWGVHIYGDELVNHMTLSSQHSEPLLSFYCQTISLSVCNSFIQPPAKDSASVAAVGGFGIHGSFFSCVNLFSLIFPAFFVCLFWTVRNQNQQR